MPSAYDYLREEEERRRRAALMNAQNPVPVQTPVTPATRQRRVFGPPSSAPASPEWQDTWNRARTEAQTPIPPELQNVVRGRDVGVSAPWARMNRTGDTVSVESFDPRGPMQAQGPQPNPITGTIPLDEQGTRPRRVVEVPPSSETLGRPRFTDPITYDSSGMPERRAGNYGADPMDTAIKYRDALQNWRPSGERSLGNTARGAGYGVLTAAEKFPGSPEAMIGGGIAGLLGSLIKPSSKNWMRRGLALGQADAEVAHQLKQAGDQAKVRQMEMTPYLREIGLQQGQQRIDQNRDKMAQQKLLAHKRSLVTIYNGTPEFDPDDPKNAALVELFERLHGFRPPKKTRGSMFQMVEGTDSNGNATFTIVHKPTATATQVAGTGLPAQTEGQLNREAAEDRMVYTQDQINRRAAENEREGGGFTAIQRQNRIDKAAELHNEVVRQREIAERASRALGTYRPDPAKPGLRPSIVVDGKTVWADEAMEIALREAKAAAAKLKAGYSDLYEAGEGDADQSGRRWAYSQPIERAPEDPKIREYPNQFFNGDYNAAEKAIRQQRATGGRTIEKAIDAFRQKVGREPTAEEIARMKAALGGSTTRASGQRWSASRWAAANPGKDVNAAIREAKKRGYTVVD